MSFAASTASFPYSAVLLNALFALACAFCLFVKALETSFSASACFFNSTIIFPVVLSYLVDIISRPAFVLFNFSCAKLNCSTASI